MKKLHIFPVLASLGMSVILAALPTIQVLALGPSAVDPSDFSEFGGQPVYLISADSGPVSTDDISGTPQQLGLYFQTKPAASFNIQIQNADLCKYHSDRNPYAPSPDIIDYGWNRGDDPTAGANVTRFSFADFSSGVVRSSVWGTVNDTATTLAGCRKLLTVDPNWLVYDVNTGRWAGYFRVDGVPRTSIGQGAASVGYTNSFRVVAPGGYGAIISYNANKYFALDAGGKMTNNYGNLVLPFAPDCTALPLGNVVKKELILKDPDNSSVTTQPNPFTFRLRNDTTGTFIGYSANSNAPNVISSSTGLSPAAANGNTVFQPSTLSGAYTSITANLLSGHAYSWYIYNVYDNNTIQFQLPYDSIYHDVSCTPPTPNGSYSISVASLDHEKGSGDKTLHYSLRMNQAPCIASGTGNTISWAAYYPYGGPDPQSVSVPNCDPRPAGTEIAGYDLIVPGGTLDSQSIGAYGSFYGRISTITGSHAMTLPYTSPSSSIAIFEVPYVRAIGHDVIACTGDVRVNNNRGYGGSFATNYGGGASHLAIVARGIITSMASAVVRTSSNPLPPSQLSSATSVFNCPSITNADIGSTSLPNLSTANSDLSSSGRYTNQLTIRPASGTPFSPVLVGSNKVTIDVANDVFIRNNIEGDITPADGINGAAVIIRASGDIYIDNHVSRIDGVLVAGGTIYTCALNSNTEVSGGNWDDVPGGGFGSGGCRRKLVVNGALVAANIRFARSIGTRLSGSQGEGATAAPLGTAAEVVNFPSYMNFVEFNMPRTSQQGFNAYYSLPPRL